MSISLTLFLSLVWISYFFDINFFAICFLYERGGVFKVSVFSKNTGGTVQTIMYKNAGLLTDVLGGWVSNE